MYAQTREFFAQTNFEQPGFLGLKVALIEQHLMGGDCLNVVCVPSKCIIRSSRVVGEMWEAELFQL